MKYWFKPKRFWKWFAFYHPVSLEGWVATMLLIDIAAILFVFVDARSDSISDTLIAFTPWLIALMCIFDLLCFRRGLYPSWWKPRKENK